MLFLNSVTGTTLLASNTKSGHRGIGVIRAYPSLVPFLVIPTQFSMGLLDFSNVLTPREGYHECK